MANNTNAGQDRLINQANNLGDTVCNMISGLEAIIDELDAMIDERDGTIKSLNETIRELTAEIESLKEVQ